MKVIEVSNKTPTVNISAQVKLTFKITGASPVPFQFPFSNESLKESKIQFVKEEA